MARPKRMEHTLMYVLKLLFMSDQKICKDAGHTKTVAVERALISYFDEYEEMKKKLKELESNQDK